MLVGPQLATLAVVLSLSVPTLAKDSSSPSYFPANLARRFANNLPSFKRTAVYKERSVNQEIKEILARANAAAASPSPSPSAYYTSAAAAEPSASQAYAREKAKKDMEYVKKLLRSTPWEVLDSSLLCPQGTTACPIFPRMGSYECVDLNELENCGGCASKGEGEDCTAIKGAQGVTCDAGFCKVFTCQEGFKLERDLKGRERCKKVKNAMA